MSVEGEIVREEAHELHRTLGPWQLIALGIGAIIGTGIFVITGHAAASYAGPGVVISFVIAGLGCLFAGLCYAEFASMIPVAGSAYTYTYATMGRFLAWFIGWNLVLEYLAAASTVAVGWSGYFNALLGSPPAVVTARHRVGARGQWKKPFEFPILALCNNAVLTTGTDIPPIDCIVLLRATMSKGLLIQMAGRGMRLSPGKKNCLLLDFAHNLETRG